MYCHKQCQKLTYDLRSNRIIPLNAIVYFNRPLKKGPAILSNVCLSHTLLLQYNIILTHSHVTFRYSDIFWLILPRISGKAYTTFRYDRHYYLCLCRIISHKLENGSTTNCLYTLFIEPYHIIEKHWLLCIIIVIFRICLPVIEKVWIE